MLEALSTTLAFEVGFINGSQILGLEQWDTIRVLDREWPINDTPVSRSRSGTFVFVSCFLKVFEI